MVEVSVCVGSSCHLKGSQSVIEAFSSLVVKENLTHMINLRASFCMGDCENGVCMEVNRKLIKNVNLQNISDIFEEEVKSII